MAETQVGTARIYGLSNASGVGAATIESADLEHKFKLDESLGQSGDAETIFGTNPQFDVTINFMPHGDANLPAVLGLITLSGFAMAQYNRTYRYIGGGSIKMVRDKECVMGLKLRAWTGAGSSSIGTS